MPAHMGPTNTPPEEADRWRTPQRVFDMLNARYGPFTLDAAADETNHKCPLWLGPGSGRPDALAADWCHYDGQPGRVFCNPPYSMTGVFVEKAKYEALARHVHSVTLLLPATTDTRWWHDYVWDTVNERPYARTVVNFSVGRIRFERPDGSLAGSPRIGSVFVTFYAERER